MKHQLYRICLLICVCALFILAVIASVFILTSDILHTSKYSLLVLVVAVFAAGSLFAIKQWVTHWETRVKEAEDEKRLSEQKARQLEQKNTELSARLAEQTSGQAQEEYLALKKKCETIEKFRNSFPLQIGEDYTIYNIIRTELTIGSHSRWMLVGEYQYQLWSCHVVRPDTQTHAGMVRKVAKTTDPSQLDNLNMSDELLWQ